MRREKDEEDDETVETNPVKRVKFNPVNPGVVRDLVSSSSSSKQVYPVPLVDHELGKQHNEFLTNLGLKEDDLIKISESNPVSETSYDDLWSFSDKEDDDDGGGGDVDHQSVEDEHPDLHTSYDPWIEHQWGNSETNPVFSCSPPAPEVYPTRDWEDFYEDPSSLSDKEHAEMVINHEFDDDDDDDVQSEEDEDISHLPENVKNWHLELHTSYEYAPFFSFHFQRFYHEFPSKHPNYFNKIARSIHDEFFLHLLRNAHVSRTKHHPYPQNVWDSVAKEVVADILFRQTKAKSLWSKVRRDSLALKDGVYANAVKAAASLLFRLHTKDYIYKMGCKPALDDQKIQLWKELELLGQKGHSVYEACGKIVQLTADEDKYSFLTECDIPEMLTGYELQLSSGKFDYRPFSTGQVNLPLFGEDRIQIRHDIGDVVVEMMPSPISQEADVRTRMLISLLDIDDYTRERKDDLVTYAMMIVDSNAMDQEETIALLLEDLLFVEMLKMKWQLTDVLQPLFILSVEILGRRYVSHEILVIVQIAELRRMVLGSRFIERSHLIWAFYECGYGLPKIRNITYLNSIDSGHPPYHIYVASMKMAKADCLKKVRLEHFVFAVLFAQDCCIFDWSEVQWSELQHDFKDFMEACSLVHSRAA